MVTRDGHVEYLFGKPWRYLVPFDQPSEFPSATPQPGSYRRYDPVLGWTIAESGQEPPLYFSDRNGYRCSQAQFEASAKSEFHREDPARVINSFGVHYTPWANAKVAEMIVASGLVEDSSAPGPKDDG